MPHKESLVGLQLEIIGVIRTCYDSSMDSDSRVFTLRSEPVQLSGKCKNFTKAENSVFRVFIVFFFWKCNLEV